MVLPTTPIKAVHKNPNILVLVAHMGIGKTSACACLPNNLLIDFESGSATMDAMRVDIKAEAALQNKHEGVVFKETLQAIKEANKAKGDFVYDYITFDGITAIEHLAHIKATNEFKTSVIGKGMIEKGAQIRDVVSDVAGGGGYRFLFSAFKELYDSCKGLAAKGIIFIAHTKQGSMLKGGQFIAANDMNLTGKLKTELLRDCSDCGYLYRSDENTVMISFKPGGNDVTIKSRSPHLSNQELVLSTFDPKTKELTVNWNLIYPGWVDKPIIVKQ